MAAIAIVPASGAIIARESACRVNITGADAVRGPNGTGGAFKYYLSFVNPAGDNGKSYLFDTSSDGKHEFNSYIFPNAGAWSILLCDAHDDSTVATASVTVL